MMSQLHIDSDVNIWGAIAEGVICDAALLTVDIGCDSTPGHGLIVPTRAPSPMTRFLLVNFAPERLGSFGQYDMQAALASSLLRRMRTLAPMEPLSSRMKQLFGLMTRSLTRS